MAKAVYWATSDADVRKRGEQTGLDTLVVHAKREYYVGESSAVVNAISTRLSSTYAPNSKELRDPAQAVDHVVN